jgi:hypothetical protein
MKKEEIEKALEKVKARSAWGKGVIEYAFDILDNIDDEEITEKNLLNGAKDWKEYSEGGCALIYDVDICHRLCTPSEIKKTKDGKRRPNKQETWIDVQASALFQAACLILKIKKEVEK